MRLPLPVFKMIGLWKIRMPQRGSSGNGRIKGYIPVHSKLISSVFS